MQIAEKNFLARDGLPCLFRSILPQDAEQMLACLRQTAGETPYMLRCEDEIRLSPDEERGFLERILAAPGAAMIGAWRDGALLGSCGLHPVGAEHRKLAHRAELGLAVIKAYWSLGIGGALLDEAIGCARSVGYEQLELDVCAGNERARRLYERRGFQETGRIPRAFRFGSGVYDDAVFMYLRL